MDNDRRALVGAILADPDDDTPRLACADWFEERGDEASIARAEFIRTQIERARLDPTDTRQAELQARELRLLKQHGATWCGSHFVFKKARFRRGFIEYVHLHLRHFLYHRRQMLALEPVRDVSLTGWMRATDDLVSRVAASEEWRHIESLRIHHQGPHKSPGSPLATLLESEHLTRLRSLRMPMLDITTDARRRIERSAVMSRLRELTLPHLDDFPNNPGAWFADGAPPEPWENLRSLHLRDYSVRPELLACLAAMPFWNRLTELDVNLGWSRPEAIVALRDRLPDSLRTLRLHGDEQWEGGTVDALCERIAELPLQGLHIHRIPLSPEALGRVLGQSSRCELRKLTLSECRLTEEHAPLIAESDRINAVWSLDLSGNLEVTSTAAAALFNSECLGSVVHLNLDGTPIGATGATALASGPWKGIREIELTASDIPEANLRSLFRSPTCHSLVSLSYQAGWQHTNPLTVNLATELVRLPHLASVRVSQVIDSAVRKVLATSESLAWARVYGDNQDVGGVYDPNNLPPLDEHQTWSDQS